MHDLLAAGVKAARQARGWTQEDAARWFRFYGLTAWRTGTVGQLEAGLRRPRLDEVILICAALGVTLEELLPGTDERVELGDGAVMAPPAIRALLAGDYTEYLKQPLESLPYAWYPGQEVLAREFEIVSAEDRRLRRLLEPIWKHPSGASANLTGGDLRDALVDLPADAERHAAKRLNVEPPQVILASRVLWGRSFTEERDQRAGHAENTSSDTLQARRGHATRAILAELRAFLDEAYADQGERDGG